MAKNPRVDKEERDFTSKCKLYFGALSARSAPYAYFNIAPDTIILSNSTSPYPKETRFIDAHGDRLMSYSIGEIGFHILRFKDQDFYLKFRSILRIPDGLYYGVCISNVLANFSKRHLDDLDVDTDIDGMMYFVRQGQELVDKRDLIAFPIEVFHVAVELKRWYDYAVRIGTPQHRERYPHVESDVNIHPKIVGRVFFEEIDVTQFKKADGSPVFRNVRPTVKLMCLDGISLVSLKEFIKKLQESSYTLKRYLWTEQDSYISALTVFEDDVVEVRSLRPNLLTIPMSNTLIKDFDHMQDIGGYSLDRSISESDE